MPMLGKSEKARLQRIFEWSNRGIGIPDPQRWRDNDQTTNKEVQLIRKQMQGSVRKQKWWLDILAKEVVERETVLKVMRAEGQQQLTKDKLRVEIQERIKRMKEIQNNIARQERIDKQSKMEAVLVDPTKCCQATYNAQMEKLKTEGKTHDGYLSNSKRLLEHNLSSATTDKPTANHRRYKHSHSPPTLPYKGSIATGGVGQTKENHHHHANNKEQDGDAKTTKHRKTRCHSEKGLKQKIFI